MTKPDPGQQGAKAALRGVMLASRKASDPDAVRLASEAIAEQVMNLPEFVAATVILGYLNMPKEVSTARILNRAWELGKQVAVPAERMDGEYAPVWLTPGDPVVTVRFGVPEPATHAWAKPDRFDLIVIPGVAFSPAGARLGHGRGYYDRMLARLRQHAGCRLGLCMEYQLVPGVPMTEDDVNMDMVVTEQAVYRSPVMTGGIRRR
jgi:5-formyltetrahydrofolate cyclo-ligase